MKSFNYMFILIFLCIIPVDGFAWHGWTHTSVTLNAIDYFPDSMRSELMAIRLKVNAPDEKRVIKHTNVGQCAWMINKLAKKSINQIQDGEHLDNVYFTIGYATHYIQDLNCPHHGIGYYEQGLHERFEERVNVGFWENADFDGFQHIHDYKIFAYNAARFSKRYIKYCNKLRNDFGKGPYYRTLVDPLWDHCVNDCIDLWLSILYDGLGEEKYREKGFPEMVGTRATKKLKFPKVEPFDYAD